MRSGWPRSDERLLLGARFVNGAAVRQVVPVAGPFVFLGALSLGSRRGVGCRSLVPRRGGGATGCPKCWGVTGTSSRSVGSVPVL
jgi:hypothetical protein